MEVWQAIINTRPASEICCAYLCAETTNDPRLCTQPVRMKCPQCEQRFCSEACFKRCWKNHKHLHKIRDEILAAHRPPVSEHEIASMVVPSGSYFGEKKIGVPRAATVEQPGLDGRGQIRFLINGIRIDGRFVNGIPLPYSKKYFPKGFGGPGEYQEIYSGHYDNRFLCAGDGMRIYANGDYFIGQWENDARAEGRMTTADGHKVFDGIVRGGGGGSGAMVQGKIYRRQRFLLGSEPKKIAPYGLYAPDIVAEIETDVWEVTCTVTGQTEGPAVMRFHRGDVFEWSWRTAAWIGRSPTS